MTALECLLCKADAFYLMGAQLIAASLQHYFVCRKKADKPNEQKRLSVRRFACIRHGRQQTLAARK